MRKLISTDEAKPTKRQHKKPCSDCPFRRDALAGWLGGQTPEHFMRLAMSDSPEPCHATIGPQCAGIAIFRANICKVPRDPEVLQLPRDKEAVFAWPNEFIEHHTKGETI